MPRTVTTTTTLYSLAELAIHHPRAHRHALSQLRTDADDRWWCTVAPELQQAFLAERKQGGLTIAMDPFSPGFRPGGYLRVPRAIIQRWLTHLDRYVEQVPVGDFWDWTGWHRTIGGERCCWIPDRDGEALLELLETLVEDLRDRLVTSYEDYTSDSALAEDAAANSDLFTADGEWVGTDEDVE